ncbi:hypothetical protein OIU80_00970 [Flavobacterium sp. LS1R47]|uniref:Lipoprotein n=1 Tax=Flavobacterium frigoritolerans TaxID=2987686 RepID=A0A9X2ZGA8_9FLAO|nr:hypothetical protein [Flavobacterium frigoritolerans]MCV9930841.1 hypothetical protein [Flavobacterium frigoritolerans]
MDISKQIKKKPRLLFFMIAILFFSCQEKVDCDEDGGTYNITFIFNKESNYVPKKGSLYFFEKNTKSTKYFESLDLLEARIVENRLDVYFKDPPDVFKAKYNYCVVLDDSLAYDISNMQMKIDTAGRTMGGWAIGCKLMSF